MQIDARTLLNLERNDFDTLAYDVFDFQYINNPVYRKFVDLLQVKSNDITKIEDIPLLPISLFKEHKISCSEDYDKIFYSSGTSKTKRSAHYINDLKFYDTISVGLFESVYGSLSGYTILALLPSYFESPESSLLHMVDNFMEVSKKPNNGYFLDNLNELIEMLEHLNKLGEKHILLGVSYALLDLAESYPRSIPNTIIMETGGMKGRRKEITREELHKKLQTAFKTDRIHSEYGMTELQSQAYSTGNGFFTTPGTMKITIRDPYDPFLNLEDSKAGSLGIIDLANYQSCSFILTSDIGRKVGGDRFEILGRLDNSDIRGCNLLVP